MHRIMVATALVLMLPALGWAQDAQSQQQVAQMAFLAQLAPKVCQGYEADNVAIAAYMARAHLNERQLLQDYGQATAEAAAVFKQSVERDAEGACDQIWRKLGVHGLGLLMGED